MTYPAHYFYAVGIAGIAVGMALEAFRRWVWRGWREWCDELAEMTEERIDS